MRRMNSFGRQGLVAAMENEELNTPEVAEVEGGAENLETDLLEVQEEAAAADADQAQVEETIETAEALESMAVSLEACAANGGLTKDAAHVVGLALDHMYKSVGIKRQPMPALESFGQTSSRVGATQLALEGLKEEIARIWKAIKDAIIKAYEWVKERFMKVFGAAEKLQKRAKALADRSAEVAGKPESEQVESERLVQALQISGKIPDLKKASEDLKKVAAAVLVDTSKEMDEAADALQGDTAADFADTVAAYAKSVAPNPISNPDAEGFGAQPEKTALHRGSELLGGKAVFARIVDGKLPDAEGFVAAARMKLYLGEFNPKAAKISLTKLPLTAGTVGEEVCKNVADLAEVVQKYRNAQSKSEAAVKKLVKAIDDASKKDDGDEGKKKLGEAKRKFSGALTGILNTLPTQASAHALNTGKALCDLVELSIKQYKAA